MGRKPAKVELGAPLMVIHLVGATASSTDWRAMVRRIVTELAKGFGLAVEAPFASADLRKALARLLPVAAGRGRVVLVIDAPERLEDRDGALDLGWLPDQVPNGVRLLLGTGEGRALDEARRRGWAELPVRPLRASERRKFVEDHLAAYRKRLDAPRLRMIAAAKGSESPLYLRTLVEELRSTAGTRRSGT